MLTGMFQASLLFLPFGLGPTHLSAQRTRRAGCLKEDEHIRLCQPLPHIPDIGMFLDDGARRVSGLLQTG